MDVDTAKQSVRAMLTAQKPEAARADSVEMEEADAVCGICGARMRHKYQLGLCGHQFCQSCLQEPSYL